MGVGGVATFLGKTVVGRVGGSKIDNNFFIVEIRFLEGRTDFNLLSNKKLL